MTTFDPTTERYVNLLGALNQAVIATDAAGTIIHWNDVAEKVYGWTADAVMGRNVLDVTPVELSRAQGADIMKALADGNVWSGEFQVRDRSGQPFAVCVTDVPLLDESRGVMGVIGVSARSKAPTEVVPLLGRFAAACETVWPQQVQLNIKIASDTFVEATEPHLIQLLSLLILRYADALQRGSALEVTAAANEKSPFAEFGLIAGKAVQAMYIRLDRRDRQTSYSVLRNVPPFAEPTQYVSALVRMVGGMLIAGIAPDEVSAMHLFLPLR